MTPVKHSGDVPSRPSSANSFNSTTTGYTRESSYGGGYGRQSYDDGRSGGYGGQDYGRSSGGYGSQYGADGAQSYQRRDFNNVDSSLMAKNAGSLGLNPDGLPAIKKEFYKEHPEVAAMTAAQVDEFRKAANMVITGRNVPKPVANFTLAGFPEAVEKKLLAAGYAQPTPIQAQGWSMALSGQNMVGIAQTGSGKTLSFVLPALVHIKGQAPLARGDGPIALVLAPTRELAVQIQDVARVFGNSVRINSTCLYGGAPKSVQIRNIRQGCEIVVATPGRLLDLLNEHIFTLQRCSFLVLDEADRMLDMGFEPQIRQILNHIRTDRQVLMWSATWPKNVMRLAHDTLGRDFIQVKIGTSELHANKKIKQTVVICEHMDKKERLTKIISDIWGAIPEPADGSKKRMVRTIIFCNKKSTVDSIYRALYQEYWPVVSIHGDKAQHERDQAIRMLKSGEAAILVATDVAARGLDVKDVMAVINFDMCDIENYVHRIGRTARGAAAEGAAYSLFTSEDAKTADELIKLMQDAGQEVSPELAAMRRGRGGGGGGSRYGGYASYGRGRGPHGGPRSHVRFNPY